MAENLCVQNCGTSALLCTVALLARRRLGLHGADLPTGDPQGVGHQPLPHWAAARCAAGLESGEPLGAEFRKDAAREIEAFKQAYRLRNPGADVDKLTDADLLRESMNTIGRGASSASTSAASSPWPCSPKAGTPTESLTSSVFAPSAASCSASR